MKDPKPAALWRLQHPLRFARALLPSVVPLGLRRRLMAIRPRSDTPWGDPQSWLAELEQFPRQRRPDNRSAHRMSVHVVAYNNLTLTKLCIESLLRLNDHPDCEIVVVDNGSTDGTAEWLQTLHESALISVIRNKENTGFAAACNQAVAASTGDVVCIANNDVVFGPDTLQQLTDELTRGARTGLVGPVTNACGNEARVSERYQTLHGMLDTARRRSAAGRDAFVIPMLAFYCVAMWRGVWNEIGGLDERFAIGMFEDDDYARRLVARRYHIVCREDAFVHHWGQAAFKLLGNGRYFDIYRANRTEFRQKWRE